MARAAPGEASVPVELKAAIHPVYLGGYAALSRELQNAVARLGITIRAVTRTMAEWMEATSHGAVDVVVGRWGTDYPDADSMVYLLHSQGGYLGRLCGSAEVDRLVEKGRAETAPAQRHALYREVEQTIAREALLLPLFHEQAYRFVRPDLEGLSVSFGNSAVAYEDLRFRAPRTG